MSLAFHDNKEPEYATKTELHYLLHVPYYKIGDAVKKGKLAIHLIDGKIQINVAEAKAVFGKAIGGRTYLSKLRPISGGSTTLM